MFAGNCRRSKDEMVSKLVLWDPKHGQRKQGRPAMTYVASLTKDTGLTVKELDNCMQDRGVWRSISSSSRQRTARPKYVSSNLCNNFLSY